MQSNKSYVPLEPNKVAHCANREICHKIHALGMYSINGVSPILNRSPVGVQNTEVERGITYWKEDWNSAAWI
jgi:hypothetical protein